MRHLRFIIKGPFAQEINEEMTQLEKDELEFKRKKKQNQANPKKVKLMMLWKDWMTE